MAGLRLLNLLPVLLLAYASGQAGAGAHVDAGLESTDEAYPIPEDFRLSDVSDARLQGFVALELGKFLFDLKEYSAAGRELQNALSEFPENIEVLSMLGICNALAGKWDEAEKHLLAANAKEPNNRDLIHLIGEFYFRKGDFDKGVKYWLSIPAETK